MRTIASLSFCAVLGLTLGGCAKEEAEPEKVPPVQVAEVVKVLMERAAP